MTIRYEQRDDRTITTIIAEEGKVFRRIGTEDVFGEEMTLGYSYYINGVLQNPPHLDVPEDFEEIDAPVEEEEETPEENFEETPEEYIDEPSE